MTPIRVVGSWIMFSIITSLILLLAISIIAYAKPYLAVQSFQKGNFVLCMIDIDSRKVQKLTDLPGDRPRVSLDGKQVVFRAATGIIVTGLGVMNTDGTNFRNITHNALDEDAAWSLNGKRIAFSRGWKDIYVIDASGGTERNITNTPQAIDNNPSWSSDGRKIAFSCVSEICVMDVDGQNRRNLTNNQWTDDIPVWSPDGRQIAFVSERGQGNLSDIYIMDSNGENQRNLTNTPLGRDDYPAWSPDGKWIAWESNGEIYVIHPNGTGLEKLTESPEIYTCPSWFDPDLGRDVFHSGKLPEAWGRLKASF